MNVFEDFVGELQEENLLEKTVIETAKDNATGFEGFDPALAPKVDSDPDEASEKQAAEAPLEPEGSAPAANEIALAPEVNADVVEAESLHSPIVDSYESQVAELAPPVKKPKYDKEFFQKRAVAEVSSLQMVEHVMTGVEREYMKILPKTFDDFNAKKALNLFLHVVEKENSTEHQEAEFALMRETEAWCSALAERDCHIQVSSLRQYCENSRPALSSQALLGLARFYRNLPYSESVRAKFDFIITRLFSRPTDGEKRTPLFDRAESFEQITKLYQEWSSIPLYTADEDESNVVFTSLSFDDLAIEAENASSFDQLVASDFFSRLRLFKESISELFFAPSVTAAAIEANIRIGNVYVSLIGRERKKMDDESIHLKYFDLNALDVSEAAGRTLDLGKVLQTSSDAEQAVREQELEAAQNTATPTTPVTGTSSRFSRIKENAFSVNKWFLGVAIVLIAASIGVYIWGNYLVIEKVPTTGVRVVDVETTSLKEHLKTARISSETFYGLLLPSWDSLSRERRQELLQKVLQEGAEKGYTQVNLIDKDGKVAGYASATRLDVIMP